MNTTYNDKGETYLDFLETNRIELNTIMTQIGAKRFWNWLYSQIIKTFPTRRYDRVIYVPPYKITLPVIRKLNEKIDKQIRDYLLDEIVSISAELHKVKGLLNTQTKRWWIHKRLTEMVDEDENITKFSKKLEQLIDSSFDDVDWDKKDL